MEICGSFLCSDGGGFMRLLHSSSSLNHIVTIAINSLLSAALALYFLVKIVRRRVPLRRVFGISSRLQLAAVVFNGCLALAYTGLAAWTLQQSSSFEAHWWGSVLSRILCLSLASVVFSARIRFVRSSFVRIWVVFSTIFACFVSFAGGVDLFEDHMASPKPWMDLLAIPGSVLLLVPVFKPCSGSEVDGDLYKRLNGESTEAAVDSGKNVTAFAGAGFLSKMTFWWLSSLMKTGYSKLLEEKDMPQLDPQDRAGECYAAFLKKLEGKTHLREGGTQISSLLLWIILSCHKRDIVVSGLFALLKILTTSSGPLLLNAFIKLSLGHEAFAHEGYVLAAGLFAVKCLESLSQRQWYFRTRRIGLQVRSLLSVAIYKKQQRLSNSAKASHSSGEITSYVTVDAYRIGEFPFWFHQTWTTSLQLCFSLGILYNAVGVATVSSMVVIVLTVLCNAPLAKLQHKFQSELMRAQDGRLKAMSESLVNMKVLKLYAWETHFKAAIEKLREEECRWLTAFLLRKAYNSFLFWSSPVLVSAATFATCYFLKVPLDPSNVFTFVATLRLVQDPVRQIPDVIAVVIQARVAFARVSSFLDAPELQQNERPVNQPLRPGTDNAIEIHSGSFSWYENTHRPTLRNLILEVKVGSKVAICGEVGSGKSTILAAILGEVTQTAGTMAVSGSTAYVSQVAWIQSGTVRENILFGSAMNSRRYEEALKRSSLVKDLEMLPFRDLTQIGERGVNLSGGQKQRVQLARALYQDADIYLLDDPFSAVDAHTATSLFQEYVMGALAHKTVVLVTHQVDFLPIFDSILLMADGEVLQAAPYEQLASTCEEFRALVDAHKDTITGHGHGQFDAAAAAVCRAPQATTPSLRNDGSVPDIAKPAESDQLIKQEERESGDSSLKPYLQYLMQSRGYIYASVSALCHLLFLAAQISQNTWMAANVQNVAVSTLKLILVYLAIGVTSMFFLFFRSTLIVVLGINTSRSLFSQLLVSLFRAPMSFFDSTPIGRILSRVSSDLSIADLDIPFSLMFSNNATMNAYSNLAVLAVITWPVLFVSVPMIFLAIKLQRYYLASARELMRINGTTKSLLANHLAESIAGSMTIRAFQEEDRFFRKCLELVDRNASPFFHNFAATEWLIQRLETMTAAILSSSALVMALLPAGTFKSGFVGLALSYGLSLNMSFVFSIQNQCNISNQIISVERLNQYMNIESEAPEVVEGSRPSADWPAVGTVEIRNLKIRYRPNGPLVLRGITCRFDGGHKVGIVGRTGSGKTTLISALFRLVEPAEGSIVVDGLDISKMGLHDLRSRFGVIPQDPTLFHGSVRYNLDPLQLYSDDQIWTVLEKCHLREAVQEKDLGLDSLVMEEGSNWSMGQRQLFCLGRALLKRSRVLVLDEATASIDNATDAILQKTIRDEFSDCTVITVAHRIPTVMDCDMVLAVGDGLLVEYDRPATLMETKGSLFRELVKEYWSRTSTDLARH